MPLDDRERSFENALARHLRPAGPSGACSDAETLAAYHEQSLAPEVTASLKTHVGECARCQQILAHLQATDEIPLASDIAQPQAAAAETGVRVIPARKQTVWRWAAPAGALAAGLLVWLTVHESNSGRFATAPSRSDAKPTETATAQPSSAPPLPPPSLEATTNSARLSADAVSPSDTARAPFSKIARAPQQPQSRGKEKDFESTRKQSPSAAGVPGGFAGGAAKLVTPSAPVLEPTPPRSVTQPVAVEPGPAAEPTHQAARGELAKTESEAKSADDKRDAPYSSALPMPAVAGAAPAPAPAPIPQQSQTVEVIAESSATATPPTHGRKAAQLLLTSGGAPVTVSAPDGRASWRIGPAGVILFSADAGKTWLVQPSGTITDLLAGSASSAKVCWIVGRSGTILRTTDKGKHWQKLSPPAQDDLHSVFAVNARQATVSVDNATYQTTDGGATWTKLPPQ